MSQVYLFCLVLGGGLAGLSVLGDVLDVGTEMDVDAADLDAADPDALDGGLDAAGDLADAGLDGAGELVEAGADVGDAAPEELSGAEAEAPDADAEKVFSLRGLVYALFGFGLAGTALGWIGYPAAAPATLALSGAAGLGSGWVTTRLVGWIRSSETGGREGESSFEGSPGRVVLPLGPGSPGRVKVRRGPRSYQLRALPYDPGGDDPADWDEVVVVEMRDGVAYVSPLDDAEDLRLSS